MAKWVDLSPSEKVKPVSELELPGVTQVSIVKKYGVSTSQVSRPSKKKEDLVRDFESGGNRSWKQKSVGKEDVGIALFLWFEQKLGQGAHLFRPLLKQKACDLLVLRERTLLFTLNNAAEI